MLQQTIEITDHEHNPIDSIEDVLNAHDWTFERLSEDELSVEVNGRQGRYFLYLVWQDARATLQFYCRYDLEIAPHNLKSAHEALARINQGLWMGHFEIAASAPSPTFRHASLLRGLSGGPLHAMIEDMIDVSMAQCERSYPAFHLLASSANDVDVQHMALALMETAGES
ncbi:MAG: YbjN domain-containing protein [Alphaproteobacteria bacterium]|nr:YbjN domain-containing protein [Alphaproteobacteria bacterium]